MHADSPEEQETQVPFLALLNEEQLAGLIAKQPPTDEASLLQWTRAVGVVPSLPQDNVTEALEGGLRNEMRCLFRRFSEGAEGASYVLSRNSMILIVIG